MASHDRIVIKFTKVLPGWLRRCGVQRADLDDAVQEALVAAVVKLRECPTGTPMDDDAARLELMRIVSNVALRARRQAQREGERYVSVANVEVPTTRDEEEWVEARVVILAAMEHLDEPARALIYAHEIEGKTYAEIATTLKIKEDAAEKRVVFAKQRLRTEVERLTRGRMRTRHTDGAFSLALVFDSLDSFDRATLGAVYEVLGKKPMLCPPAKMWTFSKPHFPTAVLSGTLALAPNSTPSRTVEAGVGQERHALSVEVPNGESPDVDFGLHFLSSPAIPLISVAQGCAATSSTVEVPSTREAPPAVEAPPAKVEAPPAKVETPPTRAVPKDESKDLSEEEKAHRERERKWNGAEAPYFDDP